MAEPNVLEIQRELVNAERAKRIADERRNKIDIRKRIARSGWYNPEGDDPDTSHHTEYPKWVHPEGDKVGRIVQNRDEEHKVMGTTPESAKSVTVDIADLGQQQSVPVAAKRGRPPKAKTTELPANLD